MLVAFKFMNLTCNKFMLNAKQRIRFGIARNKTIKNANELIR